MMAQQGTTPSQTAAAARLALLADDRTNRTSRTSTGTTRPTAVTAGSNSMSVAVSIHADANGDVELLPITGHQQSQQTATL